MIAISLLVVCLSSFSQIDRDTVFYDTVFISKISVNGIFLGTRKSIVLDKYGTPSFSYEGISEISEEEFSICRFNNDSDSYLFDRESKVYSFEYIMSKGTEIIIEGNRFIIGESASSLKDKFPNSYKTYELNKGSSIRLVGKTEKWKNVGINFRFSVKEGEIFSFDTVEEF